MRCDASWKLVDGFAYVNERGNQKDYPGTLVNYDNVIVVIALFGQKN